MSSELARLGAKRRAERKEGCLSDFALDALAAGDVDDEKAKAQRAHVESCADCRARFEARTKEAAEFAANAPRLLIPRKNKTISDRPARLYAIAVAAVAMAAGLFFYVRTTRNPIDDEGGASTRLKGASHIGFFVKRGDGVVRGTTGDLVRPGDALRFTYSTSAAGYLAILSVDGAKQASIYFPDGPRAVAIDAARDEALDSSTVLDDTLGHETLYGLFCDEPVDLEPIRAALAAAPDRAPVVDGCSVDVATIEKTGPTP